MTSKSPSLSEIAKLAKVSKSTVSLALRNNSRISKSVRERIQRMAKDLKYEQNPVSARLMHEVRASRNEKHHGVLALVTCSRHPRFHEGNHWVSLLTSGAEERARMHGYKIDTFSLYDPDISFARLVDIFGTRGIQGVIFFHIEDDADLSPVWNHFPCVVAGTRLRRFSLPFAVNDQYATGFQLGLELARLGYKRSGIVIEKHMDDMLEKRFTAGFSAGHENGEGMVPPLFLERNFSVPKSDKDRNRLGKWLKKFRPDACVCLDHYVYDWLVEMGLRIPKDLGVAFLDLTPETAGMAGMNQLPTEVAKAAADILIGRVFHREIGLCAFQQGTVVESRWQMGSTVRIQQ